MAAKLLHSLTDDNPDLQKQIGCMTGIFQMFDRQQIITGRRISGHSPKRLTSGNSHFNNGTFETESNHMYHRPTAKENNSNKNVNEKQRLSVESSRASFTSSSRSSSFSSLDCNRAAQPEPLSFDRIIFPETPSRDPAMSQSGSSPQLGRQSLDLRDVVKDSMYREARGLSVKTTTKKEPEHLVVKHKDSPRPLPHSKSVDGMQNLPADLKESLRVLAKLREAPWYPNEAGERSRSSCESNDGFLFSVPKDAPRFSYDGRELNRLSFESRDTFKSTPKLKELPRLSLDSREGSMRSFNSDSKSNFSRNSQIDGGNTSRPPSVVAKLMGLETLPDQSLSSDNPIGLIKPVENSVPFFRSSKSGDPCQPVRVSNCSQNFWKEPASPRRKNPDSVMKPISSSRFPIEPAPWKQLEGTRGSPKPVFRSAKSPAREANSCPSVYSEIEKRLKDLEFNQSGKDLRALKQILEAMQAKGLLEARGEERESNFTIQRDHEPRYTSPHLSARSVNQQKPHGDHRLSNSTYKGANSSRNFDSPIVIMKPAKLIEKHGIPASSVIPMNRLSGLPKLRGVDFADGRKSSVNSQTYREQVPKTSGRENSVSSTNNRKTSNRTLKATQTSTRSQQLPKENTQSSLKSSGSVSPRLQQKKLELEKRSRPPISPDSSKSRRQPNKQQPESSSPGGKRRPKSANLLQNDDQSSEVSSETRNLSYQEDDISMQSDSNVVSDSGMDTEVTSSDCYAETNAKYSVYGLVHKKSSPMLSEDGAFAEFGSVAPDHPSPVSVLDDTMYKDHSPSPVKQIPDALRDDGAMSSDDICSYSEDNLKSDSGDFGFSLEINRKKLENIENLVQKLRRLNSSHNEAHTDYIASLCENTNPDHRYVSEILLASGLLLRDLNSSFTTFQLHPSGHPINPELFLVLEQTKSSTRQKEEESGIEKFVHLMKPDREKFHRKLIFDAVNEILVGKLPTMGDSPEPWLKPDKLARKSLNAQKLLRELCSEIEKLQEKEPDCGLVEENDSLKGILWRDVMSRSENWTDFRGEISGMALDVERLIFKDLVSEIVNGESSSGLRTKPGRRCRRLFT